MLRAAAEEAVFDVLGGIPIAAGQEHPEGDWIGVCRLRVLQSATDENTPFRDVTFETLGGSLQQGMPKSMVMEECEKDIRFAPLLIIVIVNVGPFAAVQQRFYPQ